MDKMRRTQRKARKFLLDEGFDFVHIIHHTRWSKDIVIDGAAFDGFAIGKAFNKSVRFISPMTKIVVKNAPRIVFFQVKTNNKPSKEEIKVYEKFAKKFGVMVYIMIWYDRRGWEILRIGEPQTK